MAVKKLQQDAQSQATNTQPAAATASTMTAATTHVPEEDFVTCGAGGGCG